MNTETTSTAPVAEPRPIEHTIHGDTRVDEYAWLRGREDPEVLAHLEAENAFTEHWFASSTGDLRERLYAEMLARIKEDDTSAPVWNGAWRYYTRTEQGKPYVRYCRAPRDGGEETVLADLNEMSDGGYIAVSGFRASPDQRYMSYSVDRNGAEIYEIEILDTTTMRLLDDRLAGATGQPAAWIDETRFLYTTYDETRRPDKVWEHRLGSPQSKDRLVFHEPDGRRWTSIVRSRDGRWLFISTNTSTSGETRFASTADPETWTVVRAREEGVEYGVVAQGDRFLIHTNLDAPEFQVCEASPERPSEWRTLVPGRDDVTIDGGDAYDGVFLTLERERGLHRVRLYFDDGRTHEVSFPDAAYDVSAPGSSREYVTNVIRLEYSSLNRPETAYDLHLDTLELEVVKQQEVPGNYDPDAYETHRIEATAADGTTVPISIVRRKGAAKPGPLVLYGYGSYGAPLPLAFRPTRLALLDRGVTWAMAHIRGGGDLGERWRNAGKYLTKVNTFTDFIACADHLVDQGWTTRDRLAIGGGSAGGLLIGAVINRRPDLARCALAWVPFVDSLNTMLDASLPLTENEYEEWGNPNELEYYAYMKSYAPYENVPDGAAFPDIFATAGLNDPRVGYWEPAKWVQRLRARAGNQPLVLFRINMDAGHAGAADRYEYLREAAHDWAFLIERLGLPNEPLA